MPAFVPTIKLMPRSLKISRFYSGFTLVEFLVVLGVLTITIGATLIFLTSVLRGSNRGNVSAEVKQNGQAVLESIDSQIRNAKTATQIPASSIAGAPAGSSAIQLNLANGTYLFIGCFPSTATTNGWIGSVGPQASFAVPGLGSFVSLTNQDKVAGVDIVCDIGATGTFAVVPASSGTSDPSIVKVGFSVNQGINAPSRADFVASVRFDTTISMRQY